MSYSPHDSIFQKSSTLEVSPEELSLWSLSPQWWKPPTGRINDRFSFIFMIFEDWLCPCRTPLRDCHPPSWRRAKTLPEFLLRFLEIVSSFTRRAVMSRAGRSGPNWAVKIKAVAAGTCSLWLLYSTEGSELYSSARMHLGDGVEYTLAQGFTALLP